MDEDLHDYDDPADRQASPPPNLSEQRAGMVENVHFAPEHPPLLMEDRLPVPEALETAVDAHGIALPGFQIQSLFQNSKLACKHSKLESFHPKIRKMRYTELYQEFLVIIPCKLNF